MQNNKEFGKLRAILFPIYSNELRKFIPLTLLFFMISFNYSVLRSMKDMLILNNTQAETIYYLKLVVLPFMVLLTLIYGKISRLGDHNTRFNVVIGYFGVFFMLAYFFLIPNLYSLTLDSLAFRLEKGFPKWHGLWEAVRYWPLALFYMNSEAWGTIALGLVFWTFVNEITGTQQAKRFYSFLSLGASIGLITSGSLLKVFRTRLHTLLGISVSLMILLLIVYNIFARDIKNNPSLYQVEARPKKKKAQMSFMESLKFLSKSSYLALIAVLVIAYGMVVSLFESAWKAQIKELLQITGDESLSSMIYGDQAILSGVLAILLTVFLSAPIMNRGWRFAASVTPVVTLVATTLFFTFLYFQDSLQGVSGFFNTTPIFLAVRFGLFNVIFIKSSKYILFDTTKERAYISLDEESKIRGKAAVDGVGSRLGKSLGSLILTAVLLPFLGEGSITNVQYHIFFIILLLLIIWLVAINKLSVKFNALTEQEEKMNDTKLVVS